MLEEESAQARSFQRGEDGIGPAVGRGEFRGSSPGSWLPETARGRKNERPKMPAILIQFPVVQLFPTPCAGFDFFFCLGRSLLTNFFS
uniref:Uncharacterized protein n=1 Tax=Arundo donax TaxID=35708 RepID=A0A0A8Y3K5_ARUDO